MNHRSSAPKVALLGRPNVGKSTLFNRLIRSNRAITHDRPGITRDRMEGVVRARDKEEFVLIDTGGVTLDSHAHVEQGPEGIRGFEEAILQQSKEAMAESVLLCLVVDARDGLTPFDRHLADFLRKSDKPLILVVNKVDGPEKADLLTAEFHSLGLEIIPCSAAHGYNVRGLEDEIRERLFPSSQEEEVLSADEEASIQGASRRLRKKLKADILRNRGGEQDQAEDAEDVADEARNSSSDVSPDLSDDAPLMLEELSPEEEEALLEAELAAAEQEDFTEEDEDFSALEEEVFAALAHTSGEIEIATSVASNTVSGDFQPEPFTGPLRLAILGRPNAGKSSLVNAMAGKNRMIVSDMAGTTRDSVDVDVVIDGEMCTFVDTAGVRRRAKITDTVERYSVNSSIKSTTKAHVTLLMLDASEGLTQQDKRLIDLLHERKTPFMVLVNKNDLLDQKLRKEIEKDYREALIFCPHVPLLFISALKKRNLKQIVPLARQIRTECGVRIGTGKLNRAMEMVLERHQPPIVKRARPKFFYLTQAESLPPTFVFFVSDADRILPAYSRYLERALRKIFSIAHAPVRVHFRSSHKKKDGRK